MKGEVTVKIQDKDVTIGYEYDHEEMKLGTGAGDSGQAGCTSLNILSIHASDTDWIELLDSYRLTISLLNDITDELLKSIS